MARASVPAVGAVLSGTGSDGARGLKLMREAGCQTLVQNPASALVGEAPGAAMAAGAADTPHDLDALAEAILTGCSQG